MFWHSLFLNSVEYLFIAWGLYTLYEGLIARKPFVIIDNITKNQVNSMTFDGTKGLSYHCLIAVGQFLIAYMVFELI